MNIFGNRATLPPHQAFIDAVADGYTDDAAAGAAGWTTEEADAWAKAHPREYGIACNKREHKYQELLMATGRGVDIARVAMRRETKSWNVKTEPAPPRSIEDYLD